VGAVHAIAVHQEGKLAALPKEGWVQVLPRGQRPVLLELAKVPSVKQ
jgi:hypothetical protein